MDLPTTVVILLVIAAIVGWLAGARDGRALEAFGAGFIGYRSYGWPRGVQEEDSVQFTFRERRRREEEAAEAELIDLDRSPADITLRRLR